MLDEKTGIGTFWSGHLPGRRAAMFATSTRIGGWQRMEIGSANNLNYWVDRCASDFDCQITDSEQIVLDRMCRSDMFLQRFASKKIWKKIEQGEANTKARTLYSLTALKMKADATTWGDAEFLRNINYVYFLGYLGRSQNVCGKTSYGWTKSKIKKPDPTDDGQRNLVLIGSATDFYRTGAMMTHDLINPTLHLLEALGHCQLKVFTQVDLDDDPHACELSPWAAKDGKFKLKPYDYRETRAWYRERPVHGVAPARYTRRVWWIKSRDGFLYPFDPTTTIFTGKDARAGIAYHCLWVWRMAYGAPFDIRTVQKKDIDLWELVNRTVRPQCMLPVEVKLDNCVLPKRWTSRSRVSFSKPITIDLSACKAVTEPIFAYGCPKAFLKRETPAEPKVLNTNLPELVAKILAEQPSREHILKWPSGAKTILRRS